RIPSGSGLHKKGAAGRTVREAPGGATRGGGPFKKSSLAAARAPAWFPLLLFVMFGASVGSGRAEEMYKRVTATNDSNILREVRLYAEGI
ncbi:MAG: hypothetical protein Q9171_004041, partial [Xanthocarpia ochracea]